MNLQVQVSSPTGPGALPCEGAIVQTQHVAQSTLRETSFNYERLDEPTYHGAIACIPKGPTRVRMQTMKPSFSS